MQILQSSVQAAWKSINFFLVSSKIISSKNRKKRKIETENAEIKAH